MSKITSISATAVMVCAGVAMGVAAFGISQSRGGHEGVRFTGVSALEASPREKAREVQVIEVEEFIVREGEVVEFDRDTEIRCTGEVRIEGTLITADGEPGEDGASLAIISDTRVTVTGFIHLGTGGPGIDIGDNGMTGGSFFCDSPMLLYLSPAPLQAGAGGTGAPGGKGGQGGSSLVYGGNYAEDRGKEYAAFIGGTGGAGGPPLLLDQDKWIWIQGGEGGDGGDAEHYVDMSTRVARGVGDPGSDLVGPNGQDGDPVPDCTVGEKGLSPANQQGGTGGVGSVGTNADPINGVAATNGKPGGKGGDGTGGRGGNGSNGGHCCGPGGQGGNGGDGGEAGNGIGGTGGQGGAGGEGHVNPDMPSANGGKGGGGGDGYGGDGGSGANGGNGTISAGDGGSYKSGQKGKEGKGGNGGPGGTVGQNGVQGPQGSWGGRVGGSQGTSGSDGVSPCPVVNP